MTIRYSQLLTITWRALLAGLLALAISACGTGDEEVAGIDGSGDKVVPPIAPDAPDEPKIPDEPDPEPPLPDATIAVEGTINGFGSVIVHGERYDTSRAQFYRNGMPASERDFEVGDMVALLGFRDEGKLYARDVYFTPALSGRIENFNEQEGTILLFGQNVTLDADTVIGAELNSAALWGQNVTISGWQSDGQVRATRIAVSQRAETSIVRGNVRSIDGGGRAYVGDIWIDLSTLAEVPELQQGDLAYFEGEVKFPADNGPRYLQASYAERVASTLSSGQAAIETVTAAGILRNIAQNTYFTMNGVQVNLSSATQSLTPNVSVSDLKAGQLVVVQGEPTGNGQINARTIKVLEFENKMPYSGLIEDVTPTSITTNGMDFDITATTAIVDIQQPHSRIAADDLRVGEYIVLSAINYGEGYEALSIKRTVQGINDFKYDGTDEVAYDWGFPVGNPSDKTGENLLYSARVHAAHPDTNEIEIGPWSLADAVDGMPLRIQVKTAEDNYSKVFDDDGNIGTLVQTESVVQEIFNHLSGGRLVWVNMQGDKRPARIFVDKMHIMVDREGRFIQDMPIPAEPESTQ